MHFEHIVINHKFHCIQLQKEHFSKEGLVGKFQTFQSHDVSYLHIFKYHLHKYIYILPLHTCTAWPTQTAGGIFACNVQAYIFFGVRGLGRGFLDKMLYRYPVIVIPGTFTLYR